MVPEFSAALHTYNQSDFLEEAIEAILGQTVKPAQVVIVDDGSTDHSWELIQRYGSVATIKRIKNQGPSAARRAAVELCTSPWIAFSDSDDRWEPNHLERFGELTDRYPDADFVFSNFREFGPYASEAPSKFDTAPQGWWEAFPARDSRDFALLGRETFGPWLTFNPVFPTAMAVRRAFYDAIGGIDASYSMTTCEDAEFTRRCLAYGTVACDFQPTVWIRKHGANYSRNICSNLRGKAEILVDLLEGGHVPDGLEEDVRREVIRTRRSALTLAISNMDLAEYELVKRVSPRATLRTRHKIKALLLDLRLLSRIAR